MTTTAQSYETPAAPAPVGLPPEQVHAWLEHVQEDLRRVRARLEYLHAEQQRLEQQQQLLAELLGAASS